MTLPTAEQVINLPDIETQWVVRATHHAETYFNIINSIDAKTFNLTKIDDEIYDDFMKTFPEVNLNDVDEDQLKSPEGKVKWREWIMKYENRVNDYNFGTLLRKNVKGDYTEDNTIFGMFPMNLIHTMSKIYQKENNELNSLLTYIQFSGCK
ncbi:5844_t:CDS:2 [Paraglomus occultum]|uniref:5844_t:CDS:1 n=1 Tax=Paraglomus occultum TaxID=144539 RepID=A0A9N8YYY6_9GLOM|nr:5844_t:CDS:2 [Paraglomus occultum]